MKLKKTTIHNFITYGVIIAAYIAIEILISAGMISNLIKGLLVPLCVYSILAVSLNLVVGISGELSLGHAGFMCVGAFAGAFFTKCMAGTIPDTACFILAILIGAAAAGVCGVIIGVPVLRLRGDYLAIVTLAFGEIIKNIINVIYIGKDAEGFHFAINKSTGIKLGEGGEWIIKGAQGITGTKTFSTFTAGIILLLITLVVVLHFIDSRTGRAVMAIRDDRIAAEATGINITKYKLMAFTVSATLAGVAGTLYAHNLSTLTATPKAFGYNMSIMILVFVVLGGIGSIRGSVVAAVVLSMLPELLRGLDKYRMLVYAIVLIVTMLFNWSPKALEWREKHSLKRLFIKKGANGDGNA